MGGNALKHLSPIRLTSAEMVGMVHYLQRNWTLQGREPFMVVPWVEEKETHGDLDLICVATKEEVFTFLATMNVQDEPVANDRVISAPVRFPSEGIAPSEHPIVQVDFICCAPAEAVPMRFYYSGGDFGMLLGRVASWYGLSFGMEGLKLRAANPAERDILLTAKPTEILSELVYSTMLPRFTTYESMWKFVLSSPMAKPFMLSTRNTNAENRSRDKKRASLTALQEWLAATYGAEWDVPTFPRVEQRHAIRWAHQRFHRDFQAVFDRQVEKSEAQRRVLRLFGSGLANIILAPTNAPNSAAAILQATKYTRPRKSTIIAACQTRAAWDAVMEQTYHVLLEEAEQRGLSLNPGLHKLPEWNTFHSFVFKEAK